MMSADDARTDLLTRFGRWLDWKGKTYSTQIKYIHYLDKICEGFGCDITDLVSTPDDFDKKMKEFEFRVNGAPSSLETYKSAFRSYRDFISERESERDIEDWVTLTDNGKWYCEYHVSEIKPWWSFVCTLNNKRRDVNNYGSQAQWVFRGQGFEQWHLETSLGRIVYGNKKNSGSGKFLKEHENDSMWEFSREAAKDLEFRDFKGLNLLALMQHFGCRTRLLDFSISPLVALYMAICQNSDDMSKVKVYFDMFRKKEGGNNGLLNPAIALWAIDVNSFYRSSGEQMSWKSAVRKDFDKGDKIVNNAGDCMDRGVSVVFPSACNHRVSAQGGLFLMPNSLNWGFEENLCCALRRRKRFEQPELLGVDDLRSYLKSGIYKFVIGYDKIAELKELITDANVTAKNVYPDLVGLGKYVTDMIH